jgi:metal-responsive CopG/Arc/MetJ family transcriptional regulator
MPTVSIYLNEAVLEELDSRRGLVPRSAFINDLVRSSLWPGDAKPPQGLTRQDISAMARVSVEPYEHEAYVAHEQPVDVPATSLFNCPDCGETHPLGPCPPAVS